MLFTTFLDQLVIMVFTPQFLFLDPYIEERNSTNAIHMTTYIVSSVVGWNKFYKILILQLF